MRLLLQGNTARLVFALVLSVVAFVFAGGLMFTSGFMISLAAALPLTVLALHVPSLFVRIFGIGKPILQYFHRLSSHDWVLKLTSRLRVTLYRALCARTSALSEREGTGRILALLADDIGHAQNLVLRGVLPVAGAWMLALVVIALAGVLSPVLCCVLAVLLVVSTLLVPAVCARANARRADELKRIDRELYEVLSDDVLGITDWLLSGRRDACVSRAVRMRERRHACEGAMRRLRRVNNLIAQMLFCACVVALVVWAACVFADAGELGGLAGIIAHASGINAPAYAPNWIAAFALCFFPLIEAFAPAELALEDVRMQHKVLERLDEYVSEAEREKPMAATDGQGDGPVPALANFDIVARSLGFSYPGAAPLFEGFDLVIPQGTTVAVIGPSGAGKTTLAKLIHGDLEPTNGQVTIGGMPTRAFGDAISQVVGIVEQDPYLFDMSLRENLLIAKPDASDEELVNVLRAVELGGLLESLPEGLGTRIQERGMRFSGGERHRIALARILLADQPIVILDEPFASLDMQTEERLLDTMLATLAGKTVIAITHHRRDIDSFDEVIVLGSDGA